MTSPALQEIVAVLASPAAGNPAQYLFERALAAAGLDWRVITCDVPPERFAEAVAGAAAMGFRGCLVSGPLRKAASDLAATASPAATFAGAVGLLERTGDGFAGHITDGRGLIEAVRAHLDPAGREVLVLGAGPVGRAVALEMALAGVARVVVTDPDESRAALLVADLAGVDAGPAEAVAWTDRLMMPEQVAVVVRATPDPVRLEGLEGATVVADMAAGAAAAPEAVAAGCCIVEGLEIRAVQAAIDFQTLTGLEPDIEMLREALDEYLS
jgi:shikimate dehydrogenase